MGSGLFVVSTGDNANGFAALNFKKAAYVSQRGVFDSEANMAEPVGPMIIRPGPDNEAEAGYDERCYRVEDGTLNNGSRFLFFGGPGFRPHNCQ